MHIFKGSHSIYNDYKKLKKRVKKKKRFHNFVGRQEERLKLHYSFQKEMIKKSLHVKKKKKLDNTWKVCINTVYNCTDVLHKSRTT